MATFCQHGPEAEPQKGADEHQVRVISDDGDDGGNPTNDHQLQEERDERKGEQAQAAVRFERPERHCRFPSSTGITAPCRLLNLYRFAGVAQRFLDGCIEFEAYRLLS